MPAVVIEAIKLVEGGLVDLCDEVWFVTCAAAAQRSRLASRGLAPEDAAARIAAQGTILEYSGPIAVRVIDTSDSIERTRTRTIEAYQAAVSTR